MTKTETAPESMGHGSHWVEVNGRNHGGEKEEIFFYVNTEWRGRDAIVTMTANRYVHTGGWSEWRIYATEAREGRYVRHPESGEIGTWPDFGGERGSDLTDLARQRLSAACKPLVVAWLDSVDYTASEHRAYLDNVARTFRDTYDPARDARERADLFLKLGKIGGPDRVKVERTAKAWEAYKVSLATI